MLTVGNSRWQPVLTSVKRATFSLISYASSGKSLPLTAGPKFRRWYARVTTVGCDSSLSKRIEKFYRSPLRALQVYFTTC